MRLEPSIESSEFARRWRTLLLRYTLFYIVLRIIWLLARFKPIFTFQKHKSKHEFHHWRFTCQIGFRIEKTKPSSLGISLILFKRYALVKHSVSKLTRLLDILSWCLQILVCREHPLQVIFSFCFHESSALQRVLISKYVLQEDSSWIATGLTSRYHVFFRGLVRSRKCPEAVRVIRRRKSKPQANKVCVNTSCCTA